MPQLVSEDNLRGMGTVGRKSTAPFVTFIHTIFLPWVITSISQGPINPHVLRPDIHSCRSTYKIMIRQKVPTACDNCRRRKVKCDGQQPSESGETGRLNAPSLTQEMVRMSPLSDTDGHKLRLQSPK